MNPITIIIETPKGSAQKYTYDKKLKCFKLGKLLPQGMVFPFDFGFIPGSKGEDGDPLDILLVSEFKSFPGCAIDCRIIGAIKAIQQKADEKEIRNDRFIGVPVESVLFKDVTVIEQLPSMFMQQLEDFFTNYNKAAGKKFTVLEILSAHEAYKLIS